MSATNYPFIPEKASQVEDGQFFYIPLSDGRYACGRILLVKRTAGRRTMRALVGLHDWVSENKPKSEDIHGCSILEQGVFNILSIGHISGEIIGYKNLEDDNLIPLKQFEAGYLIDGFDYLKRLKKEEYSNYTRRSTYGLNVIRIKAERHFVKDS